MAYAPGTPEWLRSIAIEPDYKAISEGLIRAANRIERLANAYRKLPYDSLKTIADTMQTAQHNVQKGIVHIPTAAGVPLRVQGEKKPPVFRIATLDNDDMDMLPEWVNESSNMGIGYLDPAEIVLQSDPAVGDEGKVNYRLETMKLLTQGDRGHVVLKGPTKTIVLEKAVAVKWEMKASKTANLAILELQAKSAEVK